jgi:hypothetical protein
MTKGLEDNQLRLGKILGKILLINLLCYLKLGVGFLAAAWCIRVGRLELQKQPLPRAIHQYPLVLDLQTPANNSNLFLSVCRLSNFYF